MKPSERKAWTEVLAGRINEQIDQRLVTLARPASGGSTPSKMGNHFVLTDGRRFASKLEADRYLELKALRLAGQVRYFLRQVPFELAYRVTYRVDFQVFWRRPQKRVDGEEGATFWNGDEGVLVTYEDTKGFLTETARVKLRLVRELYGVHVRLLKRAGVKRMRT